MTNDMVRLTATEAVARLRAREISPLELIDAAEARVAAIDAKVNALPTAMLRAGACACTRSHGREAARCRSRSTAGLPGFRLRSRISSMSRVCARRMARPIFRNHVPSASHPLVLRIERKGGIVIAKSNTPEFGAGGNTFNEVFGRTRNPWNTALTCGGSTGGGAVALATGMAWLAHGSDHGGSLRGPATLCSVVGLRPSPGRVTRGTANNLFSPLSVQGPMARNIPDLALFLDAMAGHCPLDPLTFDAPPTSFVAAPLPPAPASASRLYCELRWARTGGRARRVRSAHAKCAASSPWAASSRKRFRSWGPSRTYSCALRSQHFVVDRELQLQTHRDLIKPDIIWNTEQGLASTPSKLAWADRERAALYRRFAEFFRDWDVLVTPGAPTPAWDVMVRARNEIDGVKLTNYIAGSVLTSAITLTSCPAVSVPCGFDRHGRPIGLQIVAPARGEGPRLPQRHYSNTPPGSIGYCRSIRVQGSFQPDRASVCRWWSRPPARPGIDFFSATVGLAAFTDADGAGSFTRTPIA